MRDGIAMARYSFNCLLLKQGFKNKNARKREKLTVCLFFFYINVLFKNSYFV